MILPKAILNVSSDIIAFTTKKVQNKIELLFCTHKLLIQTLYIGALTAR